MPTRAQNQVRRRWGIGKGKLHRRMRRSRETLYNFATNAAYAQMPHPATIRAAHRAIDHLVGDSEIAAAYREAEKEKEVRDVKGEASMESG